ncbi:hypothetical protein MIZ03_1148 [Rhodoferax lithotrophicus]|uniref:Uncharacterized protein n=1 Tax=Rhodoferax lithotrophicus TaxID=2798804 RepID=A0ABN6D3Q9_9BURK|nr:hypothetical protein MIZ03_1148 [Rhodoferax sp. MIZ03]
MQIVCRSTEQRQSAATTFLFGLIFAQVFKPFLSSNSKRIIHKKRQHV